MAIHHADHLGRTFHALGDRSRRQMLSAIQREGACSAGHLAALFDSAQPTISKHLKVLEEAELIARSVDGRHHIFTLRPDRMNQAQAWLELHLRFWRESLDQLDGLLDALQHSKGHVK